MQPDRADLDWGRFDRAEASLNLGLAYVVVEDPIHPCRGSGVVGQQAIDAVELGVLCQGRLVQAPEHDDAVGPLRNRDANIALNFAESCDDVALDQSPLAVDWAPQSLTQDAQLPMSLGPLMAGGAAIIQALDEETLQEIGSLLSQIL